MNNYLVEFNLSDEALDKLHIYANNLIETNKKINLTSIVDLDEIYIKHFYDSLLLYKVNSNITDLFDIGTGAGFPGVPYSIANPKAKVYLNESNTKKCSYLSTLRQVLNLNNIYIINERAELVKQTFNFVTSRAVAKINILLELAIPRLNVGGIFYCLKGTNYIQELDEAKNAIDKLNVKIEKINKFVLPNNLGERYIIEFKKIKETPNKYPRRYSNIVKNPL